MLGPHYRRQKPGSDFQRPLSSNVERWERRRRSDNRVPAIETFPVKCFLCSRHCLLGRKHRCLQRISLLFKSLSPTRACPEPETQRPMEPRILSPFQLQPQLTTTQNWRQWNLMRDLPSTWSKMISRSSLGTAKERRSGPSSDADSWDISGENLAAAITASNNFFLLRNV